MMKFNLTGHRTVDGSGSYFINQLENLDPRLYMPLFSTTYARDIKFRPGVTSSQESVSFIQSTFGGPGTLSNVGGQLTTDSPPGKGGMIPWVAPEAGAIPGVSIDGQRVVAPLRQAARMLSYTDVELERSQLLGQPIDVQKLDALNSLYQMSLDRMTYVGDPSVGATGLLNNSAVTTGAVTGAAWASATAAVILAQVNSLLTAVWKQSGYSICPSHLLVPPTQFGILASQTVSTAGNVSILKYLEDNSISLRENGRPLEIHSCKWNAGIGSGSADLMCAYTNDENRVRLPVVPIRRKTAFYQNLSFNAPYEWFMAPLEFVYPETVGYAYGI